MTDTGAYIQRLEVSNPLIERTVRSAIQALQLPLGSRGLDAGCGIGFQALLLAEAVGPGGQVTGLDISPAFLRHAEGKVKKSGLSERISFQQGDVRKLPFDDGTFDWAWSASCVGYGAEEPVPLVREMARVVRPSGTVAILVWSSQMLLPGYPLLEARLNATSSGIAPFTKSMRPESHWLCALGWFHEVGLKEPRAQTFVGGFHAPLSGEIRDALISLFDMRWIGVESELTEEDWAEYRRLCLPDSPDFLVNRPDYYAFFTETLFHGKVSA